MVCLNNLPVNGDPLTSYFLQQKGPSSVQQTISGRILTPYFESLDYYDYVVKGEVINSKEVDSFHGKVGTLQIKITDKLGQEVEDTIWIEPIIEVGGYYFNYEELEQYYFALKSNEKGLFYRPSDLYALLKIDNGTVTSFFIPFDIHIRKMRKMKTNKFEKKLKRILND